MNLLLSCLNFVLLAIYGNILYKFLEENKKKAQDKPKEPVKESNLVDLPMKYEQQYNYSDEERKKTLSDDISLVKDE